MGDDEWFQSPLSDAQSSGDALVWSVNRDDFTCPVEEINSEAFSSTNIRSFWSEVLSSMVVHVAKHGMDNLLHLNVAEHRDEIWLSCLYNALGSANWAEKNMESNKLLLGPHPLRIKFSHVKPAELAEVLVEKRRDDTLLASATRHPEIPAIVMKNLMMKVYRQEPILNNYPAITAAEKEAARALRTPDFLSGTIRRDLWRAVLPHSEIPTESPSTVDEIPGPALGCIDGPWTPGFEVIVLDEGTSPVSAPDHSQRVAMKNAAQSQSSHLVLGLDSNSLAANIGSELACQTGLICHDGASSAIPGNDDDGNKINKSDDIILLDDSSPSANVSDGLTGSDPDHSILHIPSSPSDGHNAVASGSVVFPELHLDQFSLIGGRYRLLFPRPPTCGVCFDFEHGTTACPHRLCSHCSAVDAHVSSACPTIARCSECREIDHGPASRCSSRPSQVSKQDFWCKLCQSADPTHTETVCPSLWRRKSHRSSANPAKSASKMLIACYACGNKNHYGADCPSVPKSIALLKGGPCNTFSAEYAASFKIQSRDSAPTADVCSVSSGVGDLQKSSKKRSRIPPPLEPAKSRRPYLDDTDSSDLEEYERQVDRVGEYYIGGKLDQAIELEDDPFARLGQASIKQRQGNGNTPGTAGDPEVEPESITPGKRWSHQQKQSNAATAKKKMTFNLGSLQNNSIVVASSPGELAHPLSAPPGTTTMTTMMSENTFVPPSITQLVPKPIRPPPVVSLPPTPLSAPPSSFRPRRSPGLPVARNGFGPGSVHGYRGRGFRR